MQSVGRDVTSHVHARIEAEERERFQSRLADISGELLRADPSRMTEPTNAALAKIGQAYDLDEVGTWWLQPEGVWIRTYLWASDPWVDEARRWLGSYSVDTLFVLQSILFVLAVTALFVDLIVRRRRDARAVRKD